MSPEQMISKINTILCQQFELAQDDLKPEKNLFTDLGLDSLDAIDLAVRFQKEFAIRASTEDLKSIRTLSDVYQLVQRYSQTSPNIN